MDGHGNCARVVVVAQLEAVNMAGEKSPDMCSHFILFHRGRGHLRRAHCCYILIPGVN